MSNSAHWSSYTVKLKTFSRRNKKKITLLTGHLGLLGILIGIFSPLHDWPDQKIHQLIKGMKQNVRRSYRCWARGFHWDIDKMPKLSSGISCVLQLCPWKVGLHLIYPVLNVNPSRWTNISWAVWFRISLSLRLRSLPVCLSLRHCSLAAARSPGFLFSARSCRGT